MTAILIIAAALLGALWAGRRSRRYYVPHDDPDLIGDDVTACCDDGCDDAGYASDSDSGSGSRDE